MCGNAPSTSINFSYIEARKIYRLATKNYKSTTKAFGIWSKWYDYHFGCESSKVRFSKCPQQYYIKMNYAT